MSVYAHIYKIGFGTQKFSWSLCIIHYSHDGSWSYKNIGILKQRMGSQGTKLSAPLLEKEK